MKSLICNIFKYIDSVVEVIIDPIFVSQIF